MQMKFVCALLTVGCGMLLSACQPVTADSMASALAGQPAEAPAQGEGEPAVRGAAGDLPDGNAVATVTASSLRVRAEPSAGAEVVAGVRQGEQYSVIGRSSDGLWIELAIPRAVQGRGWVSADFVTVAGSVAAAEVIDVAPAAAAQNEAASPPLPAGMARVIAEGARLRVRAEPSAAAAIVGWLQPGELVPVTARSADGLWARVDAGAGVENPEGGWVRVEFLLLGSE